MPTIHLREIRFHRLDMKTRFPFRYGIASMTELPHLFVSVTVEVDGRMANGISADGLPPKWFTKNPETTFEEDDLPQMLRVIRNAADIGTQIGRQPSFFAWWKELYDSQHDWAQSNEVPQLLAGLGTSLIERAVVDALCRSCELTFFQAVNQNVLEIQLSDVREELGAAMPSDILPTKPRDHVCLRHTIGLGDPLTANQLETERPEDGLPFTLEENIQAYGLRYFKIKLSGKPGADQARLQEIAAIIEREVGQDAKFTLDGNENFETIRHFREVFEQLVESTNLRAFFKRSLICVEQPVHRSVALDDSVGDELRDWPDAPAIIIDESDGDLDSLPKALLLGYSGTSHKNCKGIVKGIVNAALIRSVSRASAGATVLTAEDLANVGPVALLQDLAVVAALGISHVERNGHHYFAGLSMFGDAVQNDMVRQHADLYEMNNSQFAALVPSDGELALSSVNKAPFGLGVSLNLDQFPRWDASVW